MVLSVGNHAGKQALQLCWKWQDYLGFFLPWKRGAVRSSASRSWTPKYACVHACMHAKSLQSWPALCDPMDCSLPGFSVHGILQTRILKWVAMPSSGGSSWPRNRSCISCIVSCIAGRFFTAELPGKPWTPEAGCLDYWLLTLSN